MSIYNTKLCVLNLFCVPQEKKNTGTNDNSHFWVNYPPLNIISKMNKLSFVLRKALAFFVSVYLCNAMLLECPDTLWLLNVCTGRCLFSLGHPVP